MKERSKEGKKKRDKKKIKGNSKKKKRLEWKKERSFVPIGRCSLAAETKVFNELIGFTI